VKKAISVLTLVCLMTLAAASQPKVIRCAPACNLAQKHLHVVTRIARKSVHVASFPLRHPLRLLKDIF